VIWDCAGKITLIKRELQEIVILISTLTTQLGVMLTNKDDLLINSFGIISLLACKLSPFRWKDDKS